MTESTQTLDSFRALVTDGVDEEREIHPVNTYFIQHTSLQNCVSIVNFCLQRAHISCTLKSSENRFQKGISRVP